MTLTINELFLVAVAKGNMSEITSFVEQGADINFIEPLSGKNALYAACVHDNIPVIKFLIGKGINVNKYLNIKYSAPPGQENNVTALMFAQSAEAVEMLLMAGASLNAQDSDGWTPLMRVTYNGKVDAVKTILEIGADYRKKNSKKETALDIARQRLRFYACIPNNEHEEYWSRRKSDLMTICKLLNR